MFTKAITTVCLIWIATGDAECDVWGQLVADSPVVTVAECAASLAADMEDIADSVVDLEGDDRVHVVSISGRCE